MPTMPGEGAIEVVAHEDHSALIITVLIDNVQVQVITLSAYQLREYRRAIAAIAILSQGVR